MNNEKEIKEIIEQNNTIAKMIIALANHTINYGEGKERVYSVAKKAVVDSESSDISLNTTIDQGRAIIDTLNGYAKVVINYSEGYRDVFDTSLNK